MKVLNLRAGVVQEFQGLTRMFLRKKTQAY
jgi:hypothetical protein